LFSAGGMVLLNSKSSRLNRMRQYQFGY